MITQNLGFTQQSYATIVRIEMLAISAKSLKLNSVILLHDITTCKMAEVNNC